MHYHSGQELRAVSQEAQARTRFNLGFALEHASIKLFEDRPQHLWGSPSAPHNHQQSFARLFGILIRYVRIQSAGLLPFRMVDTKVCFDGLPPEVKLQLLRRHEILKRLSLLIVERIAVLLVPKL